MKAPAILQTFEIRSFFSLSFLFYLLLYLLFYLLFRHRNTSGL